QKPVEKVEVAQHTQLIEVENFAPSFDCAKASTLLENMICGDRELSDLDIKLNSLYSKAKNSSSNKDELRQEQLLWFKDRNSCVTKNCIADSYKQRISQLNGE